MYGYRLPEKPEKLFFCSLSFHSLSPILYTYPSLCVRQHDLVFLRHMDHNTVLQTFLKNLAIKLPTLCGYPFGVESRIVYAVPKLCHWSESLAKANLCENLLPANKSEFLSSVPKSTTLSNQQNSTDNAETENKLPPAIYNCLPQIEMYNVGKDILKQQEKMIPVFKRKLCASVAPQSVNSVIIEKKQSLPGDFQSLPNMNYDSVTLPNKVPIIVNKKPRSRPQVQTDVDVEALARNRDLARVNTATLVNWLRTKNVPCKVKDRKSHLVEKVMNHLNLPQLNEILT
ncbi:uncharacterized protein [Periplaneta americana]|uniref:uncharacterized protein n=1 Tax=Periplaneta americana TaxID=6978 RepID=UPI0037E7A557